MRRARQDELEQRWLTYAIDVVCTDDHDDDCRKAGGGCLESDAPWNLRWPGYVGARIAERGVLFVGNVHRDFASNGVPDDISRALTSTTIALRDDPGSHGLRYISDIRNAYLRGLTGGGQRGSWTVARPFARILRRTQLTWDNVTYTNASKAQQTPGANIKRLTEGCLDRWPLNELAETLELSAIVTCSAPARKWLTQHEIAHHYFPQQGWSYPQLDAIADAIASA